MKADLLGRQALVCGASQGIGRAAAIALAERGASVIVLARQVEALDALVRLLPKNHAEQAHGYISADIAEHDSLVRKVQASANARPIEILINNTAGPAPGAVQSATAEQFLDTFQRHLLANHALAQTVLPGMKAQAFGRIINVISTSVKEPIRNLGVSNTIRGAVASWAKTLAAEVAAQGITVNNVLPGFTRTQRLEQIIVERMQATGQDRESIERGMLASVPAQRFAEPAEIAAAIAFLASPAAGYVNGINLPVDGGRTQSL